MVAGHTAQAVPAARPAAVLATVEPAAAVTPFQRYPLTQAQLSTSRDVSDSRWQTRAPRRQR